MAAPKGVKWHDRVAWDGTQAYFLCQKRSEHPSGKKVGTLHFAFRRDAEHFRAEHDRTYHGLTRPQVEIKILQATTDWLAHFRKLVEKGKRSADTLRHYDYMTELLHAGFLPAENLAELSPKRISEFCGWMEKETDSAGAATIHALKALRTMLRFQGVTPSWQIPRDEIDPERHPKRDLDAATIVKLIRAMPPGSVEEAATALKARTGMRDAEIRAANVEDVDFKEKLIEPMLKSKRRSRRHVYPLEDDVLALLRPFTRWASGDAKRAGDPLLHTETKRYGRRRLGKTTLRLPLARASKAAKIVPPIQSLGPIRAEVATVLYDRRSPKEAADFLGHRDEATTRRWYVKDKVTAERLKAKRRVARILAEVVPLRA